MIQIIGAHYWIELLSGNPTHSQLLQGKAFTVPGLALTQNKLLQTKYFGESAYPRKHPRYIRAFHLTRLCRFNFPNERVCLGGKRYKFQTT